MLEAFRKLPETVQQEVMDQFRQLLEERGRGDEWRLAVWDEMVENIVSKLSQNGIDILERN